MFPKGLYALADDGASSPLSVEAQSEALLRGGVRVFQLSSSSMTGWTGRCSGGPTGYTSARRT